MIVEDEYNPRPKTVLSPGHPNHQAWCAGIAAEMLGLKDRNVFEPVTWDSLTAQEKKMCLTSRPLLSLCPFCHFCTQRMRTCALAQIDSSHDGTPEHIVYMHSALSLCFSI